MHDFKSLTVKFLRELARKHLGRGHSKLKTREELTAALKGFIPGVSGDEAAMANVNDASEPQKHGAGDDTASSTSDVDAPRTAVTATEESPLATKGPERASSVDVKTRSGAATEKKLKHSDAGEAKQAAAPPVQHEAEPLVEGFFVARIVGEEEARRHRMTDDANRHAVETRSKAVYEEHLGDLPTSYGDDSAIALPKDPTTVFFYWDFNDRTQRGAFEGMLDPKALMRVFDGDTLVREMDFALESKSFYVQGLTPGRRYRLEAHAIGRDGLTQRIGRSTNLVLVPSEGPSADGTVRFLRAPWTLPVGRMVDAIRGGEAKVSESVGPRRYLEMQEWEENANSATHIQRRVNERLEDAPERGPKDVQLRRRMLGASDRHMGASGWPSGRK